MKQTFELINATPHDIQLKQTPLPPYLGDRRGNPKGLRTQETGSQEPIGRFQTDIGPIDVYEKEYAGLTDESCEDFQQVIDTARQQNTETLGQRVAHIVISSPLAVFC